MVKIDCKPFSPVEQVNIGRAIENQVKVAAAKRMEPGGKLPQGGKSRDIVAQMLGTPGKTYEKAKAVIEAAEAGQAASGLLGRMCRATTAVRGVFFRSKPNFR